MYRKALPARFKDAKLDTLHASFECVKEYTLTLPLHMRAGEGLLLVGPPGVGKTYAIAAMTNAAVAGIDYTVDNQKRNMKLKDWVFATAPSLFESYALPYDGGDKDQTRLYESVQWLVINDLGKEYRGGAYAQQVPYKLGRLLRARVEGRFVTHITTNLSLHDDEENPGMSIQKVYGESIYSLLMEVCPHRYEVNGPDRRKPQQEN